MGLCAPSWNEKYELMLKKMHHMYDTVKIDQRFDFSQKPMWNHKLQCWVVGNTIVPNWTPDEVAFKNVKKQEKNMLTKSQEDIVIENFRQKLSDLRKSQGYVSRKCAEYGSKLSKIIEEIDNIEDVLEELDPEDEENDEE